jgi:hypothetical protein
MTRKLLIGVLVCLVVELHSAASAQTGGGELGQGMCATVADFAPTFPGGGLPTARRRSIAVPLGHQHRAGVLRDSDTPLPSDVVIPGRTFEPVPFLGAPAGTAFVWSIGSLPPDTGGDRSSLLDLGVSVSTRRDRDRGTRRCSRANAPSLPVTPTAAEIWKRLRSTRGRSCGSPPGTHESGRHPRQPLLPAIERSVPHHGVRSLLGSASTWLPYRSGRLGIRRRHHVDRRPERSRAGPICRGGEFLVARYVLAAPLASLFGRDVGLHDLRHRHHSRADPMLRERGSVLRTTRGRG